MEDKQETKLCGRCSKPKGNGEGFCNCGRPTSYKEEFNQKVDEYLELHKDEEIQVVKQSSEKYEMFDNKLKVKLPTLKGFSIFIGVNETTLYEWDKEYPEFSKSLDKIRTEQHDRLVNNGLSGDYNATIAKLILSSNHGMRERGDITSNDKDLIPETITPEEKQALLNLLK